MSPCVPVAKLPRSSGFQFTGGPYEVPVVYSVALRGRLVIEPPLDDADAEADADGDVVVLLDDDELPPLVHAVAVPSASTARAAVPYLADRHRRAVVLSVDLTCSYLLTSKSF